MARVILIEPRRFVDERGWFSETYSRRAMAGIGIPDTFVQDNHSLSLRVGTIRGLHFQLPPRGQAKLVRCTAGRILDVVVDIRRGSPTYGRHLSVELSPENGRQIFVPIGFAHGFVTREPDTEVLYKVSDDYAPDHERGIRFDSIELDWGLPREGGVLSDRDRALPPLPEFDSPFPYDGEPMPDTLG